MPLERLQYRVWELLQEQHGPITASPRCPICGGMGVILIEVDPKDGYVGGRPFRCLCQKDAVIAKHIAALIADSGNVSERAKHLTYADFEKHPHCAEAAEFVRAVAQGNGVAGLHGRYCTGVLLYGETGSGKTSLAYVGLRDCIEGGRNAGWVGYRGFIQRILDSYASGWEGPTRSQMIDFVCQLPLLVLDDFGAGGDFDQYGRPLRAKDHAIGVMLDILDYRVPRNLPMIITSNLDLAGIKAHAGDRIADRIQEQCAPVLMTGRSFRAEPEPEMEMVQ